MMLSTSNNLDCPTHPADTKLITASTNLSTGSKLDCPVLTHRKRNKGFTLIEVIIAIAIFSFIALGANALLTFVTSSNEVSSTRAQQLESLQRAMLIMERDFLQMQQRIPRAQGLENELVVSGGEFEFDSDAYGIGFVRGGWRNPELRLNRSHLQNVAYRLQENRLERLHTNYVDSVIGTEPKVRVLLQGVSDFNIEVLKELSERLDWTDSIENTELPIAVSVTITTEAFGEINRIFLVGA
jgi:general secretion pathway protein J